MKNNVPLKGREFETIWNVAHKWGNLDPTTSKVESLDDEAKIRIQRIARAIMFRQLSLRRADNLPVMDSPYLLVNFFVDPVTFWKVRNTYFTDEFDHAFLNTHYISRSELLRWCETQYLTYPEFWLEDNSISQIPQQQRDKPASQKDKDKAACRAIAQSFWKIDPRIHPSHMAESYFLREYGNAKNYRDDKTVRGWIADLDPQAELRKPGRPNDIEYFIDLKSGDSSKKTITTF